MTARGPDPDDPYGFIPKARTEGFVFGIVFVAAFGGGFYFAIESLAAFKAGAHPEGFTTLALALVLLVFANRIYRRTVG